MQNKNIVLCSDGTGNTAIKGRGTNVFKLYEAVDIHGHKNDPTVRQQIAYYDDGVGSGAGWLGRAVGGAFGWGFSKNICDLYTELAHAYEPGDHLYLFGFSRGAYTIRALAGMIQYWGIIDVSHLGNAALAARVRRCWEEFHRAEFVPERDTGRRKRLPDWRAAARPRDEPDPETVERRRSAGAREPEASINIELVGVWDTVGAVGVPIDELKWLTDWLWPSRFKELTAGREVRRACQALAIDEERRTFRPELWNETGPRDQQVEQVWFAGAHANVGGGYPRHGMSIVALDWMMAQAERCGLRFIEADRLYARTHQDVHDRLYDSRAGAGLYYRWQPRDIITICEDHGIARPKIHVSVFERIALATDGYVPGNLPFDCEVAGTPGIPGGPAGWPAKNVLETIADRVRKRAREFPDDGSHSLLEGAAATVLCGRRSYGAFLGVSLAGLALLACPTRWVRGLGARVCDLSRLCEPRGPLGVPPWLRDRAGLIAMLLVAFFAIGIWTSRVDRRLEKRGSDFWRDLRKSLRDLVP